MDEEYQIVYVDNLKKPHGESLDEAFKITMYNKQVTISSNAYVSFFAQPTGKLRVVCWAKFIGSGYS